MDRLPYLLKSPRLRLRAWSPADGRQLREAIDRSDAHLRPWIPFMREEPRTLDDTMRQLGRLRAQFDLGENFRFAVLPREGEALLGETMLLSRAGTGAFEIGYLTFADHTGQGYAGEAAAAMVRLAFEGFRVDRLEIHCAPENVASAAIPARLGFLHEATLARRGTNTDGPVQDLMVWTLFAEDYHRSPAAEQALEAYDALGEALF